MSCKCPQSPGNAYESLQAHMKRGEGKTATHAMGLASGAVSD
jgi:hypothetical protein